MSDRIAKFSLINSQSVLNSLTKAFPCNAIRGGVLRSILVVLFLAKLNIFIKNNSTKG